MELQKKEEGKMPIELVLFVVIGLLAIILILVFRKQVAESLKFQKKEARDQKQIYSDAIVACAVKAQWLNSWPNPAELHKFIEQLSDSVRSDKMVLTKKVARRFRFNNFLEASRALHRLERDILPRATAMMKKKKRNK